MSGSEESMPASTPGSAGPVQSTPEVQPALAASSDAAPQAPVAEPVKPKTPEYVTVGFMYKFVLVAALLSSCLAVFVYDRMFATKILVFDLQQYLMKIRSDAVSNKLTPEEFKARLDRMETAVTSVPKGTVVITGDVILGDNARQLEVPGFKPEKKQGQGTQSQVQAQPSQNQTQGQ